MIDGAARLAAALLVLTLFGGCALLKSPAQTDSPAAPREPPALRVTVRAPPELEALLARHLDIARLAELARGQQVDESEKSRLVGAAPAQARELLRTQGYFSPEIAVQRSGDDVTLTVAAGPRARIGRLDIEVQGPLQDAADDGQADARATLEALRANWALPVGEPFVDKDWSSAKTDLLSRLRGAGYATASYAGTAAVVDPQAHEVRLLAIVDSGPRFRAGQLVVEGLEYQDLRTVENLAGFGPGTPLTETLLLDFQDRLRAANLFDTISIAYDTDPAHAAAATVTVHLTEAVRQIWTVGIGYSANTGAGASLEHLHRRPFGMPWTARNKIEWNRLRQAWEGELATQPLEGQHRWLIGGAMERLESADDIVLSQRLRLGRAQNTPRIDRLSFIEVERSSRELLVPDPELPAGDELAVSLNQHWVVRRLDDPVLPTRGWTLTLQGGVGRAHSSFRADGPFTRLYGQAIGYLPLGEQWHLQARLELGQLFRGTDVGIPDTLLFRAGGDDSVRGYAYRSLGPLVGGAVAGGDSLLTASIEVARPIIASLPSVWGAAFVDAGNAAESFAALTPSLGAGVGVRWRSPVGPLRLDLAYGFETQRVRLHFSVGIAF